MTREVQHLFLAQQVSCRLASDKMCTNILSPKDTTSGPSPCCTIQPVLGRLVTMGHRLLHGACTPDNTTRGVNFSSSSSRRHAPVGDALSQSLAWSLVGRAPSKGLRPKWCEPKQVAPAAYKPRQHGYPSPYLPMWCVPVCVSVKDNTSTASQAQPTPTSGRVELAYHRPTMFNERSLPSCSPLYKSEYEHQSDNEDASQGSPLHNSILSRSSSSGSSSSAISCSVLPSSPDSAATQAAASPIGAVDVSPGLLVESAPTAAATQHIVGEQQVVASIATVDLLTRVPVTWVQQLLRQLTKKDMQALLQSSKGVRGMLLQSCPQLSVQVAVDIMGTALQGLPLHVAVTVMSAALQGLPLQVAVSVMSAALQGLPLQVAVSVMGAVLQDLQMHPYQQQPAALPTDVQVAGQAAPSSATHNTPTEGASLRGDCDVLMACATGAANESKRKMAPSMTQTTAVTMPLAGPTPSLPTSAPAPRTKPHKAPWNGSTKVTDNSNRPTSLGKTSKSTKLAARSNMPGPKSTFLSAVPTSLRPPSLPPSLGSRASTPNATSLGSNSSTPGTHTNTRTTPSPGGRRTTMPGQLTPASGKPTIVTGKRPAAPGRPAASH